MLSLDFKPAYIRALHLHSRELTALIDHDRKSQLTDGQRQEKAEPGDLGACVRTVLDMYRKLIIDQSKNPLSEIVFKVYLGLLTSLHSHPSIFKEAQYSVQAFLAKIGTKDSSREATRLILYELLNLPSSLVIHGNQLSANQPRKILLLKRGPSLGNLRKQSDMGNLDLSKSQSVLSIPSLSSNPLSSRERDSMAGR